MTWHQIGAKPLSKPMMTQSLNAYLHHNVIYLNVCQSEQKCGHNHYSKVIMGAMASQITSLKNVYSIIYSGADQREHQSSASLVFVRGIHRWPVNSLHKGPITRKIFLFDDVIMAAMYNRVKSWYIFPGRHSMKTSHIPMFLHIATRVWGRRWYTQT